MPPSPNSMDEHVRQFLGHKLGLPLGSTEGIVSFRFLASEGGAYSEYTEWDFSANVYVTLADGEHLVYLSEGDVVEMLNGYKP